MIYNEESQSIRNALRDSRIEALTIFLGDFVNLLHKEGFSVEDLLDAISKWMCAHKTAPDSVVKHLEDAVMEMSRVKSKQDAIKINN